VRSVNITKLIINVQQEDYYIVWTQVYRPSKTGGWATRTHGCSWAFAQPKHNGTEKKKPIKKKKKKGKKKDEKKTHNLHRRDVGFPIGVDALSRSYIL
jgi:hypothetical protein